jgi:DNA mismatch endonuclease (patch repair protein)
MAEGIAQAWVATQRGAHLAGRRKSGTRPELALRRAVHRLGLRYRVDHPLAAGCRPDLVFIGARLAVFVDGCFWHGCSRHAKTVVGGPNRDLWAAKLARNRRNDLRANSVAATLGYQVLRLWECEVLPAPGMAAARVLAAVRSAPLRRGP